MKPFARYLANLELSSVKLLYVLFVSIQFRAFQPMEKEKKTCGKIEISLTAFARKLDAQQKQLMENGIV